VASAIVGAPQLASKIAASPELAAFLNELNVKAL
jgi:hypothetical protein